MKSILKEIAIIFLLCLAICLILAIIFYDYIPINKVIPSKVEAYKTSDAIKNEINEEIVEYPKQNVVFEVTDSDLSLYKQSKSYDPGKANPFAANPTSTNISTNISSGGISSTTNTEQNQNQNTSETFFNDTPTK